MAELQILNSSHQWQTVNVTGPRFLIGRRNSCHLILKDGWISREHTLIIETIPGEFTVQDLQSENGTFVNGDPITEAPLRNQDRLRVGHTEMLFVNLAGSETPRGPMKQATGPRAASGAIDDGQLMTITTEVDEESEPTLAPHASGQGRSDQRDRMRQFEKLLQVREEEIARLAAENAVINRALAQAGLLNPETLQADLQRLTTPGPAPLAHPAAVAQTWNPLARVVFPAVDGDIVAPRIEDGRHDVAIGLLRLNVLGLGNRGLRLADAFCRVGYRHVTAVGRGGGVPEETMLTDSARILLDLPDGADDTEAGRAALRDAHLEMARSFKGELWTRADLDLMVCGLGEVPGGATVGTFLDLLEDFQRMVNEPSDSAMATKGVIAVVPDKESLAQPETRARVNEALAELRVLSQAGRIGVVVLVEQERVESIVEGAGGESAVLGDDLIAGAFDALNRLASIDPVGGDLHPASARKLLLGSGICSIGLGAAWGTEEKSLRKAVEYSLRDGVLASMNGASRTRAATVVALIGKTVLDTDSRILDRVQKAIEGARQILPQAQVTAGIYVDNGQGVRMLTCLGGLALPEKFGD